MRSALYFVVLAAPSLFAQVKPSAAIPATPITSPAQAAPAATATVPSRRAKVIWQGGTLRVDASNSSLTGILQDIALRTGMKIVGSVQDERVFGTYGPAPAADVLQKLLDGTRCNMILQSDTAMLPLVLTLTSQNGGPTPPMPAPQQEAAPAEVSPADRAEAAERADENIDWSRKPEAAPLPPGADAPPSTPATGTTDQQSPNGVKTPQQIFDQLMRLRSSQQVAPQQ